MEQDNPIISKCKQIGDSFIFPWFRHKIIKNNQVTLSYVIIFNIYIAQINML
jgi:hypothetical protein